MTNQMNLGKLFRLGISLIIILSLCSQTTFLQVLDTSIETINGADEKNEEIPKASNSGHRDSPFVDITDSNVEYAIIAPHDFVNDLSELATWYSKIGIRTKVYSMTNVQGSPGSDLQQKIRNFLVDLNSTSSFLRYVLLVGDHELIPARYLWAGADPWNLDYSYISDYYYSGLGTNWDLNQNGIYGEWGEEDWTPDLLVGRIPIDTAGEVSGMVRKIKDYRTNPPGGEWIEKMIVWTSVMVPPNGDTYYSHKDNAFKIHNSLNNRLPPRIDKVYLADYTELEGGNYTLLDDNFTRYNAKQQFDQGAALLTFGGQAYYDESLAPMDNALAHYHGDGTSNIWGISYNYDDCDDAANGGKQPFAFIASCDTLNFSESDDTNLERWNTNPNGGLIGQIGNSGRSWRGEDPGASRGNWWMIDKFWELFFQYEGRAADAFYDMKELYGTTILPPFATPTPSPIAHGMKCNLVGYNYLGDPALDIWSSRAGNFDNVYISLFEGYHWLNMTVEDMDSQPVPGARVTLELNGRYSSAVSDAAGHVTLPYQFNMGDRPELTFHANGLIPRTVTPSVAADPADLALSGALVVSEPKPGIGMDVTLTAYVKNIGAEDAPGVKVGFYTNEFVSGNLIGNLLDLGTITPGNVKDATTTWTAKEGVQRIGVVVDPENDVAESDEENNFGEKTISVIAADLVLDVSTLSSSSGYNVSTAGTTTISIFSENVGELTAENIRYSIFAEAVTQENRVGEDYTVAYMQPEDQTNIHITMTPVPGYKQYFIVANPEDEIPETNYTNNRVSFFLFGNVPPELDTTDMENIELDESTFVYSRDLAELISDPDTDIEDIKIDEDHEPEEDVKVFIIPPFGLEVQLEEGFRDNLTIHIMVTDGYSDVIRTINISKAVVLPPPMLEPIADRTVRIGDNPLSITAVVKNSDELTDIRFSADNALIKIDTTTGQIQYTAKESDAGKVHRITITATDSRGQSGDVSFNLTVKKAYHPPILTGEIEHMVAVGTPLVFNVTYEVDVDMKDDLIFKVSQPKYASINETGTVTFKVDKEMMGGKSRKDFAFTVTLSDGKKEGTLKYTVTVMDNADDEKEEGGGGSGSMVKYILAGIGIIALVVVAIVVIIVLRKKRMEKALAAAWEARRFDRERDKEKKVGDILGFHKPVERPDEYYDEDVKEEGKKDTDKEEKKDFVIIQNIDHYVAGSQIDIKDSVLTRTNIEVEEKDENE